VFLSLFKKGRFRNVEVHFFSLSIAERGWTEAEGKN